jgi:hypothetical protein
MRNRFRELTGSLLTSGYGWSTASAVQFRDTLKNRL